MKPWPVVTHFHYRGEGFDLVFRGRKKAEDCLEVFSGTGLAGGDVVECECEVGEEELAEMPEYAQQP